MTLAYAPTVGTFRTPGRRLVTFAYRDETNDYNTLRATLDQDEYGLPSGMSGIGVDVGGYLGSVGIALAIDNPDMRVVIIEPVPANFELCIANAEANGVLGQVQVRQAAVGRGGEPLDIRHGYSGSQSMEHHAFVGNSTIAEDEPHQTERYRALGLTELLDELGTIDFLKIDAEGAEWPFLSVPEVRELPLIVGEAHAIRGHEGRDIIGLLPDHVVTLADEGFGTCGFRAVRRA